MIFDSHGLPKDTGASDYADSARLAGLMGTFGHPDMTAEKIALYVIGDQGVRYPFVDPTGNLSSNNPKNFTRDQLNCLAAGLNVLRRPDLALKLYRAAQYRNWRGQNTEADVIGSTKKFPNGADIFLFDTMSHLKTCAGQGPTIMGRINLIIDICFNAWVKPMAEPNQIMCLCKIAGPKYVKLLRKLNKKLDAAIREYWCGWRGEPEFAEFLIEKFQ
jgi:hypothetical protein